MQEFCWQKGNDFWHMMVLPVTLGCDFSMTKVLFTQFYIYYVFLSFLHFGARAVLVIAREKMKAAN